MKGEKRKIVAKYIRVSTEEQANSGYGIDIQKEKLDAFITLYDYISKDEFLYVDDGYSGTLSAEKRPALKKMMEDAEMKRFDAVLVYKVDRLARDNFITIGCVRKLDEFGIIFQSATEPFDTSNTFGNFMLQFLGATAEMDRKNILERTRNGRIAAAKAGKWVMGTPPYGYRLNKDTKKLEIVEKQAQWVRKFYEWLAYERCALREIARRANDMKIPTKLQVDNSPRQATGLWYPRTLGRMLTHELYTGKTHLRKYKKAHKGLETLDKADYLRNKSEWVEFEVPPIISRKLFDEAVAQLKKNSEFAKRRKKRSYMFSGIVYCSKCSFKLRGMFSKPTSKTAKGSRSYFGLAKKFENTKRCDYCGNVAESRLMPIWLALEKILSNPNLAYAKLKKYTSNQKSNSVIEKLTLIEKHIVSTKKEKQRLDKAYLDIGSIEESEYKERLRVNKKTENYLLAESKKFKSLIISEKERSIQVDRIGKLYKNLKNKLRNSSYETKTAILQLFVKKISLDLTANLANVEFNFPMVDSLKDNCHDGCLSKQFSLHTEIPIISSKELRKIENPTHSKYYRGHVISPVQVLSMQKSAKIKFIGGIR